MELCTAHIWTPILIFIFFHFSATFSTDGYVSVGWIEHESVLARKSFSKVSCLPFCPIFPSSMLPPFFRPVVTYHPPSLTLCSTISHQSRPSFSNHLKYNSHVLLWHILDCVYHKCKKYTPCPTPRIAPLPQNWPFSPINPPHPPLIAGTRDRLGLGEHATGRK